MLFVHVKSRDQEYIYIYIYLYRTAAYEVNGVELKMAVS